MSTNTSTSGHTVSTSPTPLPVSVSGKVPVYVQGQDTTSTSVPVDVVHVHPDPVGIGTLVFAFVAALSAIATLRQLARRSRLQFALEENGGTTYLPRILQKNQYDQSVLVRLDFLAHNVGNKTARDYYVTVLLPTTWNDVTNYGTPNQRDLTPRGIYTVGGQTYRVYKQLVDEPLYPTRWFTCGTLTFWVEPGEYVCLWHLVDENGAYPERADYGRIKIEVGSQRQVGPL